MTADAAGLPALETLDDAQLQDLMRRAGELLKERERQRQRDAIEQARAILASAGLSVQDMLDGVGRTKASGSARKPAAGGADAASARKGGTRYANPANPSQIYEKGRGRTPNWFRELSARGETPEPLA
jgi:DNA-binding protein H-NS